MPTSFDLLCSFSVRLILYRPFEEDYFVLVNGLLDGFGIVGNTVSLSMIGGQGHIHSTSDSQEGKSLPQLCLEVRSTGGADAESQFDHSFHIFSVYIDRTGVS